MSRTSRVLAPQGALALFFVVLLVATVAGATTSPTTYSAYNSDWDGTSELRAAANLATDEETVTSTTETYDASQPVATVAIVIAPQQPYTDEETERIRSFVASGGTLVVAADFGTAANDLLAGVGAVARIDGRPLRDDRSFFRTGELPVVRDIRDDPFTEGVEELTLNHPSAVVPNGARTVAATTGFAYIDAERNGLLDLEEEMQSYPVVTSEPVGQGQVVVISDPSIFVNGMRDRSDNARFADNLVTSRPDVILDFSHGATVPPFVIVGSILRDVPLLQALVVGGATVAIAAWVFVPRLGRVATRRTGASSPVTTDTATLRASLRRAHPEWDATTVDRVATVVSRRVTDARREDDTG